MAKVGVLGAGSWGTALSVLLHDNGHQVTIWSIDGNEVKMLDEKREHELKLPGVKLAEDMVITGDLEHFPNRRALQDLIESLSGKAAGSVSQKTSYLINNDSMSGSSKNKKAKTLGIPIITEEEFINMLRQEQ